MSKVKLALTDTSCRLNEPKVSEPIIFARYEHLFTHHDL